MDIRRKLKIAWRDAFNGDVPAEIIARLEGENESDINCLLTGARNKTWELLSESELRLQQEKFMIEFLDDAIKNAQENVVEKATQNGEDEVEIDSMYAKVNKSSKSKQDESHVINDKHVNESEQKSPPISQGDVSYEEISYNPCEPCKTEDRRDSYEEITFQPPDRIKIRPESLEKKDHKRKVKGSVRDRIKKFELSSSLDGDENLPENTESVSKVTPENTNKLTLESTNKLNPKAVTPSENKLAVPPKPTSPKPPPPISPRPSPAVRKRQQQSNAYEEIELPCFATTSETKKTEPPGNLDMTVSTNSVTTNTHTDKQQEDSLKDKSSVGGCEPLNQSNSVPSVNLPTTEISSLNKNTDCDKANLDKDDDHYASLNDENDQYAILKDITVIKEPTEKTVECVQNNTGKPVCSEKLPDSAVKPTFSVNEPSFSTSKSGDIKLKVSARGHFKHIDQFDDDDDEGDYATLSDFSKYGDKHKTLIEVKSGGSEKADSDLDADGAEKVKINSNLHIISSTISRSTEDLRSHYKDIDDDNIESITNEDEMKKLFSKKEETDLTASFIDGTNSVIGKSIKSLSSSDSDEEINDKTVPFAKDVSQPKVSKEPPKSSRANRKRVPDYEKWDFQALLTNPNVSAAETQDLAEDTGSEDDLSPSPYDNKLSPQLHKHFEHKTIQEENSLSDDASSNVDTRMCKSAVPHGRYSPQLSPQMRKHSTMSTASDASRQSTASVRTVQGDHDLLQRGDSVDGIDELGIKSEDEDLISLLSNDDAINTDDDKKMESSAEKKRSEQLRMRHLVVKGILESEKSYLHLIEQLVKAKRFLQMQVASDSASKISMEDITTIFYMMDQIYQKHKEFVDSLKEKVENWSDEQTIGESFKIMVLYFKLYEDYVQNYPKVLEVLPKYQDNEETWHYFEEQMELFQESSKLEDILLKPVQRMQRNTLVLHDLIKHTPEDHPDYSVLKKALRLSEENLKMYNTQSLAVRSGNFQEARQLIKSGFVVEVSKDKKMTRHLRYLFLFSDLLILTKHKAGSKHREGSFKFCWSLPLCQLNMHIKGESKYNTKESLDELKMKIGNLKVDLREEMVKEDSIKDKPFSITQRRAAKNIEKLKKKIQEQEATLVEALPCLPLNLDSESQRPHVLLFPTDYERQEWREAIDTQLKKNRERDPYDAGVAAAQLSVHDIEALINGTKLHTHVNGIGTVLLRKDEEVLSGSLNVTIHKLQGLDYPCDTYCCLEMDSYGHFYKKAQTRVCFNMSDPSWDEDFELDLDGSQTLRILCYKRRPGDEDDIVIGKCALELSVQWLNSKFNEKTITMHNISITISIRHTPASKTMKRTQSKMMTGIFGVRIEYVTKRENRTVPYIVTLCVQQVEKRALNEVGIYRVSGVTSDVQHIKKMFDKNIVAAMNQVEEADIHALTGVLKLYFRELPEPLFTDKQYKSFTQAVELKDEEGKEKCMLELLHSLPDANYYTIAFMIEHLARVAKNSAVNKMSINNLATIFGPTLLHPAMKETDIDPMLQMVRAAHDAALQSEVVQYFIKLAASGRNIRKSAQTLPR